MNNPFRVFLFKHYPWIIAFIVGLGILILKQSSPPETLWEKIGALCAGSLSVVYFVQKQKIEELQLFEKLFIRFNDRYAVMNCGLRSIQDGHDTDELNIRKVLDAYFNLCAEEYLFYKQGLILRTVWKAWCKGIEEYLTSPTISTYWAQQVQQDSQYGLTSTIIHRGAIG